MSAISKTFTTTIVRDGSTCFVPLTFDPRSVFGRVRIPVKVTLNGYTYRSTIAAMGGPPCIPLRKSNREAAGLEGGETIEVRVELDTEDRVIEPPGDFVKALKTRPPAWERWAHLSYSHQREHVESIEGAKTPRHARAASRGRRRDPSDGEAQATGDPRAERCVSNARRRISTCQKRTDTSAPWRSFPRTGEILTRRVCRGHT